jgi:hypothetical protein
MTEPDRHRVGLVIAESDERSSELLAALGLSGTQPRPVIVVCGGADDLKGQQLELAREVLGPAVGLAARRTGAAVVDGGTASGVMAIMGAERAAATLPVLLGVAPAGKVAHPGATGDGRVELEPHHTHFVLHDSDEWGRETELLIDLAEELAHGAPVVMVLAGGGRVAMSEAHEAVARGWPLFLIEGTGGAAEEIAAASRADGGRIEDLELRRIVTDGDLRCVADAEPQRLARSLSWELQDEQSLKDAWVLFATYDALSGQLRRSFERFQGSILLLGILATLLALVHDAVGGAVLHWSVVAAPILVSALIALANRRAAGKRWVVLRAAAEAIKTEIYRYRTRTGIYADEARGARDHATRQRQLAAQLDAIEARLIQTEASSGPLTPYDGPLPPAMYGTAAQDDGLSPLDAERYVALRLGDQLSYYRGKVRELDRRRTLLQVLTVAAGGVGAILAVAGLEIWIGLTTAISGAALAHLGYLQVDNTIVAYNQSAARLAGLERELRAGQIDKRSPQALHDLVTRGEAVLTTELAGWVQQMTDAMQEQQAQQAEAASTDEPDRGDRAHAPEQR